VRLTSIFGRRQDPAAANGARGAGSDVQRRRLRPEEIASGRLIVRVVKGRVEIGASPDGVARVRWQIRRGEPRIRAGRSALRISGRRIRLMLDLPPELAVTVRLRQGDVTSWGAGNDLDVRARPGRFICRELLASSVRGRAEAISLHFAAAPTSVDAAGDSVVVTVPPGPYAIDAPAGAEVTADATAVAVPAGRLVARGRDVRLLTAVDPLPLAERDRT
jgi:hypothetical protein